VFADVAEFRRGGVLPVHLSDELTVQALALQQGRRLRALLANVTHETSSLAVSLPDVHEVKLRLHDSGDRRIDHSTEPLGLRLPPFGIARIDALLAEETM